MAGLLFARAGLSVLMVEKHPDFLHDFRGDTVHPATMAGTPNINAVEGRTAVPPGT